MYTSKNCTPSIKARIAVEKRIVIKTVADLLAAGYLLTVSQGNEGEDPAKPTTDVKVLHDLLMECDDDRLYVYNGDGQCVGWVYFVYGNDGWDVISDYSINLEKELAEVNALADKLSD